MNRGLIADGPILPRLAQRFSSKIPSLLFQSTNIFFSLRALFKSEIQESVNSVQNVKSNRIADERSLHNDYPPPCLAELKNHVIPANPQENPPSDLNQLNPQISSRMAGSLIQWKKYDEKRGEVMKAELQKVADMKPISDDLFEIVNRGLK